MVAKFLLNLRLFAILSASMLISNCLQVEDHVEVFSDGVLVWNVMGQWEREVDFPWLANTFEGSKKLQYSDTLQQPSDYKLPDFFAENSPIKQQFFWEDSLNGVHQFYRKVQLNRDYPNDDGRYQDFLLMEQYRGAQWKFTAKFPGKLLSVEPIATTLDSAKGLVTWDIPISVLVGKGQEFQVRWFSPESTEVTPFYEKKQPLGISIAIGAPIIALSFLLGRYSFTYSRRRRKRKKATTIFP